MPSKIIAYVFIDYLGKKAKLSHINKRIKNGRIRRWVNCGANMRTYIQIPSIHLEI